METRESRQMPLQPPAIRPELAAQRRLQFPIGAEITLRDLEGYESGVHAQQRLREHEPVTWFDEVQAWLVTSRSLVEEVLSAHDRFTVYAEPSFVRTVLGDHMLSRDGDDHRHQRAPYDPPLRLRSVRQNYTELISELADGLLAQLRR